LTVATASSTSLQSRPAAPIQHLRIDHTKGSGPFHFILVPGLVPDGPETFLRQVKTLRAFGSLATVTYPYERFDIEAVLTSLREHILASHRAGRLPVVVGVSVGGGLCLEVLRRAREAQETLPLSALVLISPLSCTDDLAPLLKRLVDGILSESDLGAGGNPEAAVERGRTFFRALASRSVTPTPDAGGWRSLLALLTPHGIANLQERRIRDRIDRTLAAIPAAGGVERVLSMRAMQGIGTGPAARRPLTAAPTLLLWGSKERHTLNMEGPGTSVLCRPDLASRVFPACEVHWLYGADGEEIPHASLLKHAPAFNRHLRCFMERRLRHEAAKVPLLSRGAGIMPFLAARMF
jgi:pimeloyl-ACP methyl ester carboxylesterase